MTMKHIIKLIRPQQWAKNAFVFLPLFFGGKIMNIDLLCKAGITFMAFCFTASSIYCLNDIIDADSDKLHPQKCKRPIASGVVSKASAYLIMAILLLSAIVIVLAYFGWHNLSVLWILAFYFLMNIAYCLRLKRIALIDTFVIAIGFVLRVAAGGVATGVVLSHWIIIMTFLLALFLALAKRKDDIYIYESTGEIVRSNINRYNSDFLNQSISVVASITMVAYIMYTVSPEVMLRINSNYIYVSAVFVLLGILRYLQLAIVDKRSGSPTKILLKDRFIQCCIIGWVATFAVLLYV